MTSSQASTVNIESDEPSPRTPKENGETPLHLAVRLNKVQVARRLLADGADLYARDAQGKTPVHEAVSSDARAALEMILRHYPAAADARSLTGETPLMHAASYRGSKFLVEDLLRGAADVHAVDNAGKTALHWAAEDNDLGKLDLLLGHGAKVTARDELGQTPLHSAVLLNGAIAAKRLLQAGADPNARDKSGNTPLHLSVITGALSASRELIDHQANVNVRSSHRGKTPLLLFTYSEFGQEYQQLFLELISAGANIHAVDVNGSTALHEAARGVRKRKVVRSSIFYVKYLLYLGADANARDNKGYTPLHLATMYDNEDIVSTLLNHPGIDVNLRAKNGRTPLHVAGQIGNTAIVASLLAAGADITATDDEGMTALHFTACNWLLSSYDVAREEIIYENFKHDRADAATTLLEAGADVNARDNDGNTPLHMAIKSQTRHVLRVLRCHAKVDVNVHRSDGQTPLMMLVEWGYPTSYFMELINAGANVDATDNKGRTVMHYLAKGDQFNVLYLMVGQNPNVDVRDYKGRTPLYEAVRWLRPRECGILLRWYSANRNIADHEGKLPRDLAIEMDQRNILMLLDQFMPAG